MVRLIMDSLNSGPKTERCEGRMMRDDSGEVTSGSKSNIPSGVPSETCPSETLLAGDVLGGVTFRLVSWGAKKINGGEVGVFCNCGGDDGGGITDCSKIGIETIRVSVTDLVMVFVGYDGGIWITCVEVGGVISGMGNGSGSKTMS